MALVGYQLIQRSPREVYCEHKECSKVRVSDKARCNASSKQQCTAVNTSEGNSNQLEQSHFRLYPVDCEWQIEACKMTGAHYQQPCHFGSSGTNCLLIQSNFQTVRRIALDGNCLLRSFSLINTGSQENLLAVRIAILSH